MTNRSVLVRLRADVSDFVAKSQLAKAAVRDLNNEIDKSNDRTAWLAQGILALTPAVTRLGAGAVPVLSGMATQMTLTVAAAGTMAIAFNGVGDALGALNDYQLDPTAENLQQLNEAMAKIGPNGRELVEYLDSIGPALSGIANSARGEMFPGIIDGLEQIMELAPRVSVIVGEIGGAVGQLASEAGAGLSGERFEPFFEYLENRAKPILIEMGETLGNFSLGLANMLVEFDPLTAGFSEGLLEMSRSFSAWSETFADSAGFQEFVSYVQEAGPQALDFFGSLIMALVELAEAAAPVGAVMLPLLTSMLNLIGDLANTPLGPIALGFVAITSAWGRLNALAEITGSGVMAKATKGIRDNGTAAREAVPTFRQLGNAMAFSLYSSDTLTKSMESGSKAARTSAGAALNARGQVLSFGKAIGPVAGQVALLALATSDVDDKLGLTNTTSLALAGSLAGGVGAAVGATAGLLLDMKAGADEATKGLKGLDEAAAAKNVEALTKRIAEAKAELEDQDKITGFGDFFSDNLRDLSTGGAGTSVTAIYTAEIEKAEGELAELKNARQDAWDDRTVYNNIQAETAALEENIAAMRAKREEALRGANADLDYAEALLDVRDAAKEHGNVLSRTGELQAGMMRDGIEAKRELNSMAAAWNGLSDEAQNTPGAFKRARDAFVDAAMQMGVGEKAARRMAAEILNIPSEREVQIRMNVDLASQRIAAIKAELASIKDEDVNVNVRRVNAGGFGPQATSSADGSTVPDSGMGYADRFLYLLADREEVISNRRGQADKYRPALKAINADMSPGVIKGMLAGGGTAGKPRRGFEGGGPEETDAERERRERREAEREARAEERERIADERQSAREAEEDRRAREEEAVISGQEKAAQGLIDAAEKQKQAAESVLESWAAAMQRAGAAATADFRSDVFGNNQQHGLWATGTGTGGASGWRGSLDKDIAGLEERAKLIPLLTGLGVTGGALENLLGEASNSEIQQLINSGEAASYAALFNQREALLGSVSQQAGQGAYGAEYANALSAVAALGGQILVLQQQLAAISAQRGINVYEAISAQATAAEVARLQAMQGAA